MKQLIIIMLLAMATSVSAAPVQNEEVTKILTELAKRQQEAYRQEMLNQQRLIKQQVDETAWQMFMLRQQKERSK